jgi:NAD(P)-dependent dehydrogenase (short-subunit alcohol dehydrogenase family)
VGWFKAGVDRVSSVTVQRSAEAAVEEAHGEAPGRGRLEGRRVLVVGGGQEDHGIEEATAELVRAEGAEAVAVEADASSEQALTDAFARTAQAFGGIDGLVMNVGIGAGFGLRGTSAEDWDRVMAVNARSHFLGCKLAMEAMGDGGAVVLVGSIASREVMPLPAYAASKAALEALCRQAAVEGAPRIRTNLLLPGLIDTSLGRLASQISPLRDQVPIPAVRQGTAWEVAYGALYLLSGESSYVTGYSLVVDGGLTVGPRAQP